MREQSNTANINKKPVPLISSDNPDVGSDVIDISTRVNSMRRVATLAEMVKPAKENKASPRIVSELTEDQHYTLRIAKANIGVSFREMGIMFTSKTPPAPLEILTNPAKRKRTRPHRLSFEVSTDEHSDILSRAVNEGYSSAKEFILSRMFV